VEIKPGSRFIVHDAVQPVQTGIKFYMIYPGIYHEPLKFVDSGFSRQLLTQTFLMNTNLTLKFDFQTDSTDCAYSLMNMIMEKLKSLQSVCAGLKYIEVNLFTPEGSNGDNKTALFKVISNDSNIAEYSRSKRWEDACF
jgi:hypothetical protein